MKKRALAGMVFFLLAGTVRADEKDSFRKIIDENSGYFYCEGENSLIHLSLSEDNFLATKHFSFNFDNDTVRVISSGQRNIFLDDRTFFNNRAHFEIEEGELLSFLHMSDIYTPIEGLDKEAILSFMKEKTIRLFADTAGEYYEEETKQVFHISEESGILKIVAVAEDGSRREETLRIKTPTTTTGRKHRLTYSENSFELYYPDGTDYLNRMTILKREERPRFDEKIVQAELYRSNYTFGEEKQELRIDEEKAVIIRKRGHLGNCEYDLCSLQYKIFTDEYGYKHVEVEDDNFLIIDGEKQSIAFRYHGDSLREDSESVDEVFKAYPQAWARRRSPGSRHNINGGYFADVTASSSLKDQYYEYLPEGTMKVFNPGGDLRFWVKNNIPWVEGEAGDGIGESIEFDITPNDWRAIVAIDLRILNGYVDPLKPYLFYQNNRIETALIETDAGYAAEVHFKDAVEFTSVTLPKETRHVKLTIRSVYPGTKYRDTCITAFDMDYDLWDK